MVKMGLSNQSDGPPKCTEAIWELFNIVGTIVALRINKCLLKLDRIYFFTSHLWTFHKYISRIWITSLFRLYSLAQDEGFA